MAGGARLGVFDEGAWRGLWRGAILRGVVRLGGRPVRLWRGAVRLAIRFGAWAGPVRRVALSGWALWGVDSSG